MEKRFAIGCASMTRMLDGVVADHTVMRKAGGAADLPRPPFRLVVEVGRTDEWFGKDRIRTVMARARGG